MQEQSKAFAARLLRECGPDPARQVERAYRLALCRPPTSAERAALVQFLAREAEGIAREGAGGKSPAGPDGPRFRALVQACRVIFNLNEFVYPD
jgi:hypothetical protein